MPQLFAGTSGFAYPGWKPRFYPSDVPEKKFLEHYSRRLNAVEINYTFRRLPAPTTLENWVALTPPGFRFAIKAHMRITHILRLKNAGEFTEAFFRAIDPLRVTGRLGPVLFQLPPQFRCDLETLTEFLQLLPGDIQCAFEFRHASWLTEPVYRALEQRGVALCAAESEKFETPEVITAGFIYSRLRKPDYTPEDRAAIGAKARGFVGQGKDVFVFFKHEDTPEGALYAEELLRTCASGA